MAGRVGNRGRKGRGGKDAVDVYVGSRLRLRRTVLGLSQEKLGDAVGLTFQQIQKYEKGANRIGASRLFQFARALDVPPAFFFEGLDQPVGGPQPGFAEEQAGLYPTESGGSRDSLEMMRAFNTITDPAVRRRIFELVKAVAERAAT